MTNKRRAILAIATLSYTASAFQAPTTLHSATAVSHQSTTTALFSSPEAEDARNAAKSLTNDAKNPKSQQAPLSTLVNRVAVAGATGRTGKYVVQQLLSQNVPVLAMVRDVDKAANVLDPTNVLLTIRQTDLGSEKDVIAALSDGGEEGKCDAAIWAATGFSDSPDQSILDKLKAVFGLATNAQATIDAVGLPALGEGLAKTSKGGVLPKVVMLSSAGCTRPSWSEEKKLALDGSAGIPIVRLNPFGILDVKKESEEKLRSCGVEYCIFRPGGLNDSWSPNQRPIFSQGDVAVGRINRQDVAKILVDLLSTPEATGKTFEGVSIANSEGYYPPAPSIGPALDRLALDSVNGGTGPSEEVVRATYAIMQQLLPGEKQDAAKLAMGQTYEQLDKDEDGRLGKRGTEDAPIRSTS